MNDTVPPSEDVEDEEDTEEEGTVTKRRVGSMVTDTSCASRFRASTLTTTLSPVWYQSCRKRLQSGGEHIVPAKHQGNKVTSCDQPTRFHLQVCKQKQRNEITKTEMKNIQYSVSNTIQLSLKIRIETLEND